MSAPAPATMNRAKLAQRIWANVTRAAAQLRAGTAGDYLAETRPYIHLGCSFDVELIGELAKVSGGRLEIYRYIADEGSLPVVFTVLYAQAGSIEVSCQRVRPATDADAEIPMRGGRS